MIIIKKLKKKYPEVSFEATDDLSALGTINGTEYTDIKQFIADHATKDIKYIETDCAFDYTTLFYGDNGLLLSHKLFEEVAIEDFEEVIDLLTCFIFEGLTRLLPTCMGTDENIVFKVLRLDTENAYIEINNAQETWDKVQKLVLNLTDLFYLFFYNLEGNDEIVGQA